MNILTDEPVLTGALVTIITTLISRFGFNVSADVVTAISTLLGAVVAFVVRTWFTSPVKKTPRAVEGPDAQAA